ncbi:MAG: murein biosynthesis integral rane protein MurJ [Frankiales bacterium]|nr:murein biosynthesis integral rane protein MurJ [Frankiales bacterium]
MPSGARRTPSGVDGGPLQVGDSVAGRYSLLAEVAQDGPAGLWRARDEVLARTVALKVVATPNRAARDAAAGFLAAAVRTGAVNHTGLARVYDASQEARPGRGNDIAMVVSEWVDGEPLDFHLARVGPLSAPDAADVLRQAADALTAAHEAGLCHGRLHPRNVLITAAGRVRLTDLEVAAALHGTPDDRRSVVADTTALGGVLYALVTARWPAKATGLPGGGLTPAPQSDGRPLSARQLRAGVPRSLDRVVTQALDSSRTPTLPRLTTPAQLADATDAAALEARAASAEQAVVKPPSRIRKALPWLAAVAFVTAVGITGWLLGLAVGDLPRRTNGVDAIVSTTEAPTPGVARSKVLDLSKLPIKDFDPEGDGSENADQVHNAIDAIPSTTWATQIYRRENVGGKSGVGLLIDLGKPTSIKSVSIGFSAPGANVELKVSNTPPTDAKSMTTVAAATKGALVATLTPTPGTTTRYVVVWITKLPRDANGYRVGISELRITAS